nr:MAG TPA: hypothetical protein [Caudoviricetes sp.]
MEVTKMSEENEENTVLGNAELERNFEEEA